MDISEKSNDELIEYYSNEINIDEWLINDTSRSIIRFKNRTEYKKFNTYHRLNGPAIDFNNESLDRYFYRGEEFDKKIWESKILPEIRKIKLKKLNTINE